MAIIDLISTSPTTLVILTIILGLLVGSFLNVVVYRIPIMLQREWKEQCCEFLEIDPPANSKDDPTSNFKQFNLFKPDSHCPNCNHTIRAWENIPVVSYMFLKGQCSQCKEKISIRYPLVEIVTAILSALVAWTFGATWLTLLLLIFTWSLITLTLIDLDHQLLPDSIVLPLLWLGLLVNVIDLGFGVSASDALIGAMAGYMSLWSIFWMFKLITGKDGMGYGDFKLFSVLGAWMGWQILPMILILSCVVGSVVGIAMLALQGKSAPFAFGPYLAGAGFIALIWGEPLNQLYFQTFM